MLNSRYKNDGQPTWILNDLQNCFREQLLDKIKFREYSIENVEICICGSKESVVLSEKDRFGLPFGASICKQCGLVYTTPRLTNKHIALFYDNEYHGLTFGEIKAENNPILTSSKQGFKIFNYIQEFIKIDNLTVVEIGCGSGLNLSQIKDCCNSKNVDINVLGCEYALSYVNYAKNKFGINVYHGGTDTLINKNIQADFVILSHVFEHFKDLREELFLIDKLLKNDGLLYIEVPGILDLHRKYEYDCDFLKYITLSHMYNFSLTTLRNVLGWCGFSLIKGDEYIHSLFKKSKVNNGYLNDSDQIIIYLDNLEKNKEFYLKKNPKNQFKLIKRLYNILQKGNCSGCIV